jgi:hypothetical protein
LFQSRKLQDSGVIWDFQRWISSWGRLKVLDIHDLQWQIRPAVINQLISNQGFMIIYTHLFEGLGQWNQFPKNLKSHLHYLSKQFHTGKLLVSTCSRLLKYREMTQNVQFQIINTDDRTIIEIKPKWKELDQTIHLSPDTLQGLTFYCKDPGRIMIRFQNKVISVVQNQADCSGKPSVSIPWNRLIFPKLKSCV